MDWIERLCILDAPKIKEMLCDVHPGCLEGFPKELAIIGASHLGEKVAQECTACGVCILGIFDDASEVQGAVIAGHIVQPTRLLHTIPPETPVILATHRLLNLTRRLRDTGFNNAWPFPLLHIMWPKYFSVHPFYENMHHDLLYNSYRLSALREKLTDEISKDTLNAVVGFRLTLDVEVLEPVLRSQAYFPDDILSLGSDEVYCDGGAFSGDTITDFLARTNNKYKHIVAFEPSPGSFEKLSARFSSMPNVSCVQGCLHHSNTRLRFDCGDCRDSRITSGSGMACDAFSLDGLPETREFSLIKLNIEGAEEDALRGASGTLARYSPKLAIAAYHRPRDIWFLPNLILDLQPDYSLYLRQHDGGIIETVLYACSL